MLLRFRTSDPDRYPGALLRTVQRRLKIWRSEIASKLVFGVTTCAIAETVGLVHRVTGASMEVSHNVDGVAAATEELSASLGEVSQQVPRAAHIAQAANQAAH